MILSSIALHPHCVMSDVEKLTTNCDYDNGYVWLVIDSPENWLAVILLKKCGVEAEST